MTVANNGCLVKQIFFFFLLHPYKALSYRNWIFAFINQLTVLTTVFLWQSGGQECQAGGLTLLRQPSVLELYDAI